MPRKAKEKAEKPSDPKRDLLVRIRERYKVMSEADQENRRNAIADIKFANEPGAQWDANMKKERGNRPCYEFNKVRVNGKRVINSMRANRPSGKVRAVEGGDVEIAELYEGLCRNIWNTSDGDTIVDNAGEYQVDGGMTCWRVVNEYSSDTSFEQDIQVKPIKNPFCLYADPACQDMLKRDAEDWILTERISNSKYESKWPKAQRSSFEDVEFDDQEDWEDENTTRIVEYWYREPVDKEIWLVQGPDGRPISVDSTSDEAAAIPPEAIMKRREVRSSRIMMCIASGDALLEEPSEQVGSQFPFIMIYGEYKVIDGKTVWHGLHRFAKDAQQAFNVARTAIIETVAGAPKSFWWSTETQAAGNTDKWTEAHKKGFPFLLYKPDPLSPGAPQRMPGADVPIALMNAAEMGAQDLRDVTGLHEASFGEESGEKSGIALARKQSQAEIVTYNFQDNMAKGIQRTWEIMIDWIPHVYDSERELRVLGADGAEDYKKVNQIVFDPATGKTLRVNDLSVGRFDVVITSGPSFSTQRQEAAETYGNLAQAFPQVMGVAGDLVFKSMDLPYADEIAERMQALLPPQIQQMLTEGKEIPPEAQAVMQQAQQAMALVQQQTQLVQQAAQEIQQDQAKSEKSKAEVEKAIANLKTAEAQFETKVAKAIADIQKRESDLHMQSMQIDGARQQMEGQAQHHEMATADLSEAKKAVADIDSMVAQFMQAVSEAMAKIQAQSNVVIAMPKKPRMKSFRSERDRKTGALIGVPEYDGDSDEPRIARVVVKDGVGVPEYTDQAAPAQS